MKFKTKKYLLTRPKFVDILQTTTQNYQFARHQLKKKKLFLLKKKKMWQIKWLINPFFYVKRRRKMSRKFIFRIKQKKYRRYTRKKIKLSEKKLDKLRKKIQKRSQRKKKRKKKKLKSFYSKKKFKRKKKKRVVFARFMSKRRKFTRYHKGRNLLCVTHKKNLTFHGVVGFTILKSSKLKAKAIYNAFFLFRKALKKKRKKRVRFKLWNYILADVPVSQKPKLIRMGKGKGDIKFWICRASFGKFLFEINFKKRKKIKQAFKMFKKSLNRPIFMFSKFPNRWKKKFFTN